MPGGIGSRVETRMLVVDDDPSIGRQLGEIFRGRGPLVDCAPDGAVAIADLERQDYLLAFVDFRIRDTNGLHLVRDIRERWPEVDVIMVTEHATIQGAVEAIKIGASDYVTKPFQA